MLVDTFQFYNELDVLEMRLKVLDPYVDLFVLSESPETHAGKPKPLFYAENKERFAPWAHKIRYVLASPCPTTGIWDREKHQRECIKEAVRDIPDCDHIMISDVDEIPDLSKLTPEILERTHVFHMFMFEYSFKYMFTGEPWFGTVITRADAYKKLGPNFFRDHRWKFDKVPYAGWHCSSFGDAKHVWNKIQNYAHAHDEKHKFQSFEDFERYLDEGLHSDGRFKLVPTPKDIKLPINNDK